MISYLYTAPCFLLRIPVNILSFTSDQHVRDSFAIEMTQSHDISLGEGSCLACVHFLVSHFPLFIQFSDLSAHEVDPDQFSTKYVVPV